MSTEHGAAQSPSTFPLRRTLAVLVALALPLAAQAPEWTKQAPLPTGGSFDSIAVLSPTEAWVAGWYGYVARTADGGQTWVQEQLPGASGDYLECAAFKDAKAGCVAGDPGIWHRGAAALAASP